jgi:Ca2+-binding RTX toxin-like protein
VAIIDGTWRSEIIDGTPFDDKIYGYEGDDILYGYGGWDDLYGGGGWDELHGGSGRDWLYGGTGANDLFGGSGADRFIVTGATAAFSDDWIFDFQLGLDRIDVRNWGVSDFSQLKELLYNDSGDAVINAFFAGKDHYLTIEDVLKGDLISSDFIYSNGGSRNDGGTDRADVLFGSRDGDILSGFKGGDSLLGGDGGDDLYGGRGSDDLFGGDGSDILIGGFGKDQLKGGDGSDTFAFDRTSESTDGSRDRILDFDRGNDVIDVSRIDAKFGTSGDQDFDFIGTAGFSQAGQLRFENSGGDTIVYGNCNSDNAAEFSFVIKGSFTLTDSDFIL